MGEDALDPAVIESLRQLTPPGEPDVLAEVLTLFIDEGRRRVDRIRSSVQARDAAELHRAAHSFKGSSGNIGAHDLHALCREIDDRARVGDITGAGLLMDDLDREYARVEAAIAHLLG